jgi:hypothetical protein
LRNIAFLSLDTETSPPSWGGFLGILRSNYAPTDGA